MSGGRTWRGTPENTSPYAQAAELPELMGVKNAFSEPPAPAKGFIESAVLSRRFYIKRVADESGISGTGIVAEGVEFSDGTVAMRWRSHTGSVGVYANIKCVEAIHGHGGKTVVVWIDTTTLH